MEEKEKKSFWSELFGSEKSIMDILREADEELAASNAVFYESTVLLARAISPVPKETIEDLDICMHVSIERS